MMMKRSTAPSITADMPYGQNTLIFVTTCPSPLPPQHHTGYVTTLVSKAPFYSSASDACQCVLIEIASSGYCAVQQSHEGYVTAPILYWSGCCQPTTCSKWLFNICIHTQLYIYFIAWNIHHTLNRVPLAATNWSFVCHMLCGCYWV